jgi:hypothetical protein
MIFELRNQQSARYVPNTAEARKTGKIFKLQRSMDSRYLPNTVVMAQFEVNLISIPHALFSTSFNLINPALAFALPSTNPTAFAIFAAASYCSRASLTLPSISKNSPRLCVATAQPMSHSSVRSGASIVADVARAFVAHWRAWSIRMARGGVFVTGKSVGEEDIVRVEVEEVGDCWARQVDMLFTGLLVGAFVWNFGETY